MKHKVSFIITLLVALAIPQEMMAFGYSYTAPSGQTIYYKKVGNSAIITYPYNSNYSFNGSDAWRNHTKPIGDLVIPDTITDNGNNYPVTAIDDYAFYGCSELTSVSLPNTITSIVFMLFVYVRV